MTDSFDPATDITGNGSIEGQLAPSYTNWVAGEVRSAGDFIAYTWYLENGDLTKAIEISNALRSGAFSLDDLFLAANGKTGGVTDIAGIPDPKVVVAGVTIDLSDFFGDSTHVTEWSSGNARNLQYHDREYLTDFNGGTAPDGWQNPEQTNLPPEATPITVETTETLSDYAGHVITNTDPILFNVDLLQTASDPEADVLHVVGGSVTFNGGDLPDYITVDGDSINIDRNSRLLDYLKADPNDPDHSLTLTLEYQITDGNNDPITNSVTITIDGTLDEYTGHGTGTASQTVTDITVNGGGNYNSNVLNVAPLPDGQFDPTYTGGTLTFTEDGLTSTSPPHPVDQKAMVADANPDDWTGGAIHLDSGHQTATVTLTADALADAQVNYNVTFTQDDPGDSVTATLNYTYDYFYLA